MTKTEIISLIKNLLPKQDKTGKFHPRFLAAAIEKTINEMYNEAWRINPLELQRYVKGFGYDTALTISAEGATGIYYISYPTDVSIVPFPDKASGCRRVSTVVQGGLTFFPMDAREADLVVSGSNVNTVTSKIGYITLPNRIEFYNMNATVLAAGCRIDLIIPFSNYDDTDTVLIPEFKDRQGLTFTDRVLKTLQVIQPVDQIDDNSDIKISNTRQ